MSTAYSYGSTDDQHKKGAECGVVETDAEQGEGRLSFASTDAPESFYDSRGSILDMIDTFADTMHGEGVVKDEDTWMDYDDEAKQTEQDSLEDAAPKQSILPKMPKRASTKKAAVINVVNNVVGAGILTMPAAVQAASLLNAMVLMVVTGFISATSFILIGYLCSKLECSTYRQLWSKAFGARSGFLVDLCLLMNSVFGCLSFMILSCDLFEKSYPGLFHVTNAPGRNVIIWASTVLIVLPLCHLKNLSALKYTSILAIVAFVYVWTLVLHKFWTMARSEATLRFVDGQFKLDSGMLFALSIFNSAYKAHYNSPAYFTELGSDLNSFMIVSGIGFGLVMVLYVVFCVAAFGLFGNDTKGNVLKNFEQGDVAVLWAWLAMALVTLLGYPLVFKTGRDSLFSLFPPLARAQESYPLASHCAVVTTLVAFISLGACVLPDVAKVVGMAGATVGAALCWTIPAAIYIKKAKELPWSIATFSYASALFVASLACMVGCSMVVLDR